MRELTWFNENDKMVVATVVEIELADVRPMFDNHVTSVEANCGWWEVWNIGGRLCAYFIEDDDL